MKIKYRILITERYEFDKLEHFRGFLNLIGVDFGWDWYGESQRYELEIDDCEYLLILQVLKLSQLFYEMERVIE